MTNNPTPRQLAALKTFATRKGRRWKMALRELWFDGRDVGEPEGAELRQIRNQFGPSWLTDFKSF